MNTLPEITKNALLKSEKESQKEGIQLQNCNMNKRNKKLNLKLKTIK